mmetsp:Transcript_51303/g.170022  ORF Transcript_51303/g.170022 Transcript_51303/m.170022 type:complete len:227 (-) Transcript_51303:185-865(-)
MLGCVVGLQGEVVDCGRVESQLAVRAAEESHHALPLRHPWVLRRLRGGERLAHPAQAVRTRGVPALEHGHARVGQVGPRLEAHRAAPIAAAVPREARVFEQHLASHQLSRVGRSHLFATVVRFARRSKGDGLLHSLHGSEPLCCHPQHLRKGISQSRCVRFGGRHRLPQPQRVSCLGKQYPLELLPRCDSTKSRHASALAMRVCMRRCLRWSSRFEDPLSSRWTSY